LTTPSHVSVMEESCKFGLRKMKRPHNSRGFLVVSAAKHCRLASSVCVDSVRFLAIDH
jgi:hypothetical protein